MTTTHIVVPFTGGVRKVANAAARLALVAADGDVVIQLDDDNLYAWNSGTSMWIQLTTGGAGTVTIDPFDPTGVPEGLSITGTALSLHAADATNPGGVSTASQTFGGQKTFAAIPIISPFAAAGIVHNDATGLLSTSLIVNADVNAAAAIAYSKLNLANSIVNADVSATAAIAYSKLNLTGSIVNADISAAAAIARSKIAAGTASHVIVNDGSGNLSSVATLDVSRGGTGLTATPTNGQLPIGNGTGFSLATLTGTANQVNVTNGAGSITLSLPQNIHASATPQFARIGLGTSADANFLINTAGFTVNNSGGVVVNETGADADFRVEAVGDPNGMFFDASTNRLGLGTGTPLADFEIVKDAAAILYVTSFGAAAGIRPGFVVARGRGTASAIQAVQAGDFLGEFTFRGADGSSIVSSTRAGVRCRASQNWTPTANGCEFDFTTTPDGSTFPFVRTVITAGGDFGIGDFVSADVAARLHVKNAVNGPLIIFDQQRISDENIVVKHIGNSRIGVGVGDRAYNTYYLEQNDSSQAEYARHYWITEDITTGAVGGAHRFDVAMGGVMTTRLLLGKNLVLGNAALATSATDGFVYIPTCPGQPTGSPTAYTGRSPIIVDTLNDRIWAYTGTSWKSTILS